MNNRIDTMFAENRLHNRKAFIPFLTAGDPDLATTKKMVLDMAASGADLIELGIPFSDPMAEGPVIQAANVRALKGGATIEGIMNMVQEIRKEIQTPLVYLLYYNSMLTYGLDAFFARCKAVGIDGLIIPDLPFEESDEIDAYVERYQVYQIMMAAPTSASRLKEIGKKAKGFLYCVSSLGVTGMRSSFSTDFQAFFEQVHRVCDVPTCIGFGVSTPEQAADLKQYCDGVIVGSAIVKRIADGADAQAKRDAVHELVVDMRKALD